MSKKIKQMEMDALKQTFGEVRDLVLMTSNGLNAQTENQMRLSLRKKNIRMQMVKKSLARRVFSELGIQVTKPWAGTTVLAWGGSSIADLTRELKDVFKKNEKLKFTGAIAEGLEITFEQAEKMPTRAEAIARVIGLALAPASRLVGQLLGPAGRGASQIKTISEKAPAETPAPAPEPAPAAG